jgi:hypothetical protein
MSEQPNNNENENTKPPNRLRRVGLWVITPCMFSPKNANPMQGVGSIIPEIKSSVRTPKYDNVQEEYVINPEFAKIQSAVCRKVRNRRNFYGISWIFLLVCSFYFHPFPIELMNVGAYTIALIHLAGLTILTDFQLIVYQEAVVGLRLIDWIKFRLSPVKKRIRNNGN